jgi:hypothetical protein
MEHFIISEDIKVYFIEADRFPEGIGEAFEKLFSIFYENDNRKIFGISRPENGKIIYKVAASLNINDEYNENNSLIMTIQKGNYISLVVKDYLKDITLIGKAFSALTSYPNIDPNGYCIEWYDGDREVLCLVKLKD